MNRVLNRLLILVADEQGQVAMLLGLAMIPIMLGLGLIIDGGLIFFHQRQAYNATDAAALAGAREKWLKTTGWDDPFHDTCNNSIPGARLAVDAACTVAQSYGYLDTEVTVNTEPLFSIGGVHTELRYVEVIIARQYGAVIMALAGQDSYWVRTRSVAGGEPGFAPYAVYALEDQPRNCPSMKVAANSDLVIEGGVIVNGECSPAFDKSGGGDLDVDGPLDVVGGGSVTGGGTVTCSGATCPTTGVNPKPDPLGGLRDVVDAWVSDSGDLDGDGNITEILGAVLSDHCKTATDSRCTENFDLTGLPVSPGNPCPDQNLPTCAGVANGVLRIPSYVWGAPSNSTMESPDTFSVCNAPLADHAGLGLVGVPTLYPGVYPGGIKRAPGNCPIVVFMDGVYVFAGRETNGRAVDLDLSVVSYGAPSGNANQGVFWYVTRIPQAICNAQRCRYGSVNLSTDGAEVIAIAAELPSNPGATCLPPSDTLDTYEGILLFVDRGPGTEGVSLSIYSADDMAVDAVIPPEATDVTSATDNEVRVQGGGVSTILVGTLYDRWGRLFTSGSYTFDQAQLIFNVINLNTSGPVTISAPECASGTTYLPFLVE